MNQKKPELLTNARNVDEVIQYLQAGADAVVVGNETYGLRSPGNFDQAMIEEAVNMAHASGDKIYMLMNALLHHDQAQGLEDTISQLDQAGVDAIIFGDPAVLFAARKVAPKMKLFWNTETTSTNYHTVNFWAKKGASRAILARELSLTEVIGVKEHSTIEVQAQVHGMTCIFHSKRQLVSNYLRYQGNEQLEPDKESHLFLKENTRDAHQYPVYEDYHGTHIMSSEDICMLEHLPAFLQAGIDSLYIEGILKPASYNRQVISIYRRVIDLLLENPEAGVDERWMEELRRIQPAGRPLGTGFYFKAQIY